VICDHVDDEITNGFAAAAAFNANREKLYSCDSRLKSVIDAGKMKVE
jgi:hypothetical protein